MDIPQWIQIVIWLVVVLFTIIIEISTVQLVSIWFAVASIIALILAAFGVSPIIQIVVFAVLSIILFVISRFIVKKMKYGKPIDATIEGMIGEEVVVTKDIRKGEVGEIKAKYDYYTAIAPEERDDILVGEHVFITETKGNKVVVKK